MFSTSNIFGKSKDERPKIEVARELAYAVLDIVGPDGLKTNKNLILYSKDSNEKYGVIAAQFCHRPVLASLIYKFDKEETSFKKLALFMNYDKIIRHAARGEECRRFENLMLEHTNTKLFIFILLHELGHYWQKEALRNRGKLPSYIRLSQTSRDLAKDESGNIEVLLSVDELATDLYACERVHGVLGRLHQKDPNYLNCLD